MIDILYLTYNRLEFTKASLAAMAANTEWSRVRRLVMYDDGSTDGTVEFVNTFRRGLPVPSEIVETSFHSPVAVMNHFLETRQPSAIFAKIDSDVMLPPGWLGECLTMMESHPDIDLLGIEAMFPASAARLRTPVPAEFIGGIGLMRTRAFRTLPEVQGRFGFTAWQDQNPAVKKAWMNPSIPVCLLDRVPFAPWAEFSAEYVANGWQRHWDAYDEKSAALWEWWG